MSFTNFAYVATAAFQHQRQLVADAEQHRMVRRARRQQHDAWRRKPARRRDPA
jgi:hypothetical protein